LKARSLLVGACLVAALVTTGNGIAATAACNGTWQNVPSPHIGKGDNILRSVAALPNGKAWAVGYGGNPFKTLIQRYNGSEWKKVKAPSPLFRTLVDLDVVSGKNIWGVGFDNNDGRQETLVERWNGTEWKIVGSPNRTRYNVLNSVDAITGKDIWAAGSYNYGQGQIAGMMFHFNGKKWREVSIPQPDSALETLNEVVAIGSDDVYALGWKSAAFSGGVQDGTPYVIHWDGSSWSEVNLEAGRNFLAATLSTDGTLWGVGYRQPPVPFTTLAINFDGSEWIETETPNRDPENRANSFNAVASLGSDVWAAGATYDDAQGTTLIARWDGAAWTIEDSPNQGVSDDIEDMSAAGNSVWAVGSYKTKRGDYGDNVLRSLTLRRCT
jgi:hypothetical protein